ncbi:hypothetical protein JCM17823_07830 [Halorubrum gandharaense]
MNTRRLLLVCAVAGMLVLAGCTGADDGADVGDAGDDVDRSALDADADAETAEDEAYSFQDGSADGEHVAAVTAAERQLIRTGELETTVDDAAEADGTVRDIVDDHDGFVSDASRETHERRGEQFATAELVVRVPSDDFDAAMDDLEDIGEVERSAVESEDVSDELTDLDARLENLRVERDRLRDLYEEANETEDVLAVQSELSATQEEIERLEAQQASLQERVALSTITVSLREEPPEPEPAETESWYDTGVAAAFLASVSGVGTLARATVVGAAYVAPYVIAVGTPLALVGVVARRRYAGGLGELGDGGAGGEPGDDDTDTEK